MRQWASERRLFFPDGGFQHPTALKLIRTRFAPVRLSSSFIERDFCCPK